MLNWLQRFNTFSFLDNHAYSSGLSTQEVLVGAGVRHSLDLTVAEGPEAFVQLDNFVQSHKGSWIFGHLGYDFASPSSHRFNESTAGKGFGDICFFVPEIIIRFNDNRMIILAPDPQIVFDEIRETEIVSGNRQIAGKPLIRSRLTKEKYINTIDQLRQHILRGDCYEINFCQEFFAEQAVIDPVTTYERLTRLSPAPFAGFYRVRDQWLLCASPERYLKKLGNKIYSQPIKGTLKRNSSDPVTDLRRSGELYNSGKDRSENVMIVDLVRNDFSRFCKEGTVRVEELYGIYTFPQVYQMISTISGELPDNVTFAEIIKASFPMGSMTGAPKKRVMELIRQYEFNARGLFSGTVGYISPEGDFDFNVVIRSILYDQSARYLSLPAGSGITFYSDPAQEWEECMVKAAAMRAVFESEDPLGK
ncbi:MAG: anthranilate synthase component I family protein [Chitinophagaceae bacterium]